MKKPKAPRLVSVAVTTTITIIFWVFFTLYRVLTSEPDPSVDPKLLEPIDATLDTSTLDSLNTKVFFEPGEFVPVITSQPISEESEGEVVEEETNIEEGTTETEISETNEATTSAETIEPEDEEI